MVAEGRSVRPVGRVLRLLTGVAMVFVSGQAMVSAAAVLNFQVAGILVALFVLYTLIQLAMGRFVSTINPWLGAVIAVAPVFLLFALGPAGQISALMFIGVSLVATAVRADGGCEVMTLSGMPMGRRTHLVCLVFSPMDWVEDRLSGGLPRAEDKAA